jgi:hypothetical protein
VIFDEAGRERGASRPLIAREDDGRDYSRRVHPPSVVQDRRHQGVSMAAADEIWV